MPTLHNPSMMRCPECKRQNVPMVSYIGPAPLCRGCARKRRIDDYSPWMGVRDPFDGSKIPPTICNSNTYQDSSSSTTSNTVPKGVLRGIEDIENGNTASKEDLEDVLRY